jgi:major vault protein
VSVIREIKAVVINPLTGIHLRATKNLVDGSGRKRLAGEEWCVTEPGPFLPGIGEDAQRVVEGTVLTSTKALHLRAKITFEDVYGKERKAGEEWLVTSKMAPVHILGVYEETVAHVTATVLSSSQYCIIENPVVEGECKLGERKLLSGPLVRFAEPKEVVKRIAEVRVLNEDEALYVRAIEDFQDNGTKRKPGDRWLVTGPLRYWPPLEVEILEQKRAIFFVEGFPIKFFTFSQIFFYIFLVVLLAVLLPHVVPLAISEFEKFRGAK